MIPKVIFAMTTIINGQLQPSSAISSMLSRAEILGREEKELFQMTRSQFHQHSMRGFCANIFAPKKYEP
jgi:hypothetical protein